MYRLPSSQFEGLILLNQCTLVQKPVHMGWGEGLLVFQGLESCGAVHQLHSWEWTVIWNQMLSYSSL